MVLIFQLAIILIASKVAGSLSVRLGQPSVLGKLLIGIVLGPSVLGLVEGTEVLGNLSEIGVILLMFIAGLETDFKEFKRTGAAATLVGLSGIIVPFGFGLAAGSFLNFSTIGSWFLGLLLSATSVSISVQTLKEMDRLKTREGAAILGAAVIDDVVVIIALAFLMSFTSSDVNLSVVILKKVLFFAGAIAIGWKGVPWFMNKFTSLKVTETVISSALIICFTFAYLAEYTGVAAIIGSYMAGVAVSATDYKSEVLEKVETISYSIFVPVFFTSIGVTAQFTGIGKSLPVIIFISIIAILSKLIGASAGAKISGFSWRSALGIGSAMVSRGEVALIMATIGLDNNLLSSDFYAVIVVVVLVTTIATPLMMKWSFSN
ncbi:cation:proton antiporter [Aminipila terrae]|uniref:Sodium:proton antiporter n=1 Tax=Aminipila terrae TaxID=2697030 RepID=A0A6P1MFM8_9FIRM|nr:cation:proton antiporter [Aminipila terrae]QHI73519.1 sodium:proton antiporter [Aminipila terrae]